MSYMRSPIYVWSDGYWLNIWIRDTTDESDGYLSPDDLDDYPGFVGGVAINERIFDVLALYRVAELARSPKRWRKAVKRAKKLGVGNTGSFAFFEAMGEDPEGEFTRLIEEAQK